ncbi:hypothetical protein EVC30_042 [Rhizobium phage RHph_Y1_11]|nr:hypothetical protein EVC30_042 [Rhizobium phage RHph_Y1_11]
MSDTPNVKGRHGGLGGQRLIVPDPIDKRPAPSGKVYTVYVPYSYEKKDGSTGVEAATLDIHGEATIRRKSQVITVINTIKAGDPDYVNVIPLNFIPLED